jgi:serine/threonine protein kinase
VCAIGTHQAPKPVDFPARLELAAGPKCYNGSFIGVSRDRASLASTCTMPDSLETTLPGKTQRSVDDTFAPAGLVIGRHYTLHVKIGMGGMASVYLGWLSGAADFSRVVAIKRMHPQYALDEHFAERFRDEARLSARLSHPNIVQVFDVVERSKELLIVMEYVHGVSLGALASDTSLAGRRLAPNVVAGVLVPALHGLHTAHEATDETGRPIGLVHRDFSPQNIMVSADGHSKILDFGIAKAQTHVHVTSSGQFSGKLGYCSPEQISGEIMDRRADVFAAGIVLWEMLAGERLFQAPGTTDARAIQRILNQTVPAPSSINPAVPAKLDHVVARALARDPRQRYGSARELAFEVEAAVDIASPPTVATWVESACAKRLTKLTRLFDSTRQHMARTRMAVPLPAAVAVARALPAKRPAEVVEKSAQTVDVRAPESLKRRTRKPLAIAVAVLILVAGMSVRHLLLRPSHRSPSVQASSIGASGASASVAVPSFAPPAPAAIEVLPLEKASPPSSAVAAVADSAATSTPPTPREPKMAPVRARVHPSAPHRMPSTKARVRKTAAKIKGPAAPDCDPPTYIDADGIRIFKDECL